MPKSKYPEYPTINIDWNRAAREPGYADAADQILMDMRDTFQGWTEEGFDHFPLDLDDLQNCAECLGAVVMLNA